jgi:hypothetical protein
MAPEPLSADAVLVGLRNQARAQMGADLPAEGITALMLELFELLRQRTHALGALRHAVLTAGDAAEQRIQAAQQAAAEPHLPPAVEGTAAAQATINAEPPGSMQMAGATAVNVNPPAVESESR